jgi:hypothetical protein
MDVGLALAVTEITGKKVAHFTTLFPLLRFLQQINQTPSDLVLSEDQHVVVGDLRRLLLNWCDAIGNELDCLVELIHT